MKEQIKTLVNTHKKKLFHCPMDLTMNYIGGKWKTVVLWYLIGRKRRFSELKKLIPGITEKMLSIQLKQLEKDGFIFKKIFAESPPRVEYKLTDEGETLIPVLKAMSGWGMVKGKREGRLASKVNGIS
ncbi:MAG: helix-turn-helix domain-containing protein [Chitinophagaceae bacterium]